ncbi:MAG: PAS domain-containing protein, partial [Nitrospirae bacterium]
MVNITDSLKAPAILVGEDYTVEYANPAFGEFCGRPPEELLGKKCHKVSHASDSPCRLNANDCPLKYVLRTGRSTRVRHRHVCVKGSEKVFDILAIPVSLNG